MRSTIRGILRTGQTDVAANDPAPNPDLSVFGRIYFTQKDLNNDGDYVHPLV